MDDKPINPEFALVVYEARIEHLLAERSKLGNEVKRLDGLASQYAEEKEALVLQVEGLKKEVLYHSEAGIEAEREKNAALRLNGELKDALRALVVKVHEVNKGTEYLFAFAQNHSMGYYSGPQYGEELIRAGKLVDLGKSEKPKQEGCTCGTTSHIHDGNTCALALKRKEGS